MSRAIVKLPRAERDLIIYYAYLGDQRSLETADRFLDAVDTTLALIAESPGIGVPHQTSNPRLAGLRSLPVSKFKRYLLFYQTFDDRIELVRVLHGARDVGRILDATANGDEEE
ncbi:MAG: type II toxin-antitoxin system RelE/ParE family toxin [Isosphaeraceae bacterium]